MLRLGSLGLGGRRCRLRPLHTKRLHRHDLHGDKLERLLIAGAYQRYQEEQAGQNGMESDSGEKALPTAAGCFGPPGTQREDLIDGDFQGNSL
jgi:hypothetical protein